MLPALEILIALLAVVAAGALVAARLQIPSSIPLVLVGVEHRRDGAHRQLIEDHHEIEALLISAERSLINDLYRDGQLKDEGRRRIERDLDLREAHLTNLRSDG